MSEVSDWMNDWVGGWGSRWQWRSPRGTSWSHSPRTCARHLETLGNKEVGNRHHTVTSPRWLLPKRTDYTIWGTNSCRCFGHITTTSRCLQNSSEHNALVRKSEWISFVPILLTRMDPSSPFERMNAWETLKCLAVAWLIALVDWMCTPWVSVSNAVGHHTSPDFMNELPRQHDILDETREGVRFSLARRGRNILLQGALAVDGAELPDLEEAP